MNEDILSQGNLHRNPKLETIGQLEKVFVFDSETYNDQDFAEAYAARLYDVNRLRDRWVEDFTLDEILTEQDSVIVFDGSNGKNTMIMLEYI